MQKMTDAEEKICDVRLAATTSTDDIATCIKSIDALSSAQMTLSTIIPGVP